MSVTESPAVTGESRFVRGMGIDVHVLVWGHRERVAPTVVLLHGYLDQAESFRAIGDRIASSGYRVVAPDFRGHGRSNWVPDGGYYHFPDYVADVAAVLASECPDRPVALVAHSMGGSVATLLAGALSDAEASGQPRIAAMALLEGYGPPAMPASVAPDRMRRWLDALGRNVRPARRRLANLEEAVARLSGTHGGAVSIEVLTRVAEQLTEPFGDGTGLAWRFDPLHQTTSPGRFDAEAFEEFARRLQLPMLLVDGEVSLFRSADVDARRECYQHARSAVIAGAGHMMQWTHAEQVAETVLGFLRETFPADSTAA